MKSLPAQAEAVSLDCSDYDAENMPGQPVKVQPRTTTVSLSDGAITTTQPAKTFTVYTMQL